MRTFKLSSVQFVCIFQTGLTGIEMETSKMKETVHDENSRQSLAPERAAPCVCVCVRICMCVCVCVSQNTPSDLGSKAAGERGSKHSGSRGEMEGNDVKKGMMKKRGEEGCEEGESRRGRDRCRWRPPLPPSLPPTTRLANQSEHGWIRRFKSLLLITFRRISLHHALFRLISIGSLLKGAAALCDAQTSPVERPGRDLELLKSF